MSEKPRWAWSSVDDPNPIFPKCDTCEAFARWAIGDVTDDCTFDKVITRWFACGRHLNSVLMNAEWNLDTVCVYDITEPPERS